ncbi:MAG: 4Fe-4S dicluster domain-containing protein, partial [Deltaproteobacteria bacterium]|nr:4Fe-4S dicluster domain-containing protein [Deltaproteobacteria bacterium]
MGKGYNTIAVYPDKCNGCNDCIEACAQAKAGSTDPGHSRIRVAKDPDDEYYGVALCRQCGDPDCVKNCPSGALSKDPETGVVQWDEQKCVNCLLCTLTCSYAGITSNGLTGQVMKCDMCDGEVPCVKSCKEGALELTGSADIFNRWGDLEDLFVPGLSACLGCNSELLIR